MIISYTGFRRFYLVINIGGRYYKIKIGTSPDLTVKEARKKVMKLKKDIANGIHPMEERRKINRERREKRHKRLELQNGLTFGHVADKYRNRRKRFGLRFNLISDIYNFELR
ncbi:hypothetical protein OTSGILL_0259 [Orientia tsutsugamushi str. Gilliam]|uniref:Integrase DNA-binding domain-containing protein n=1 Tax=Orientia tsutsugamushi str. Gilliam TaxID=1359184 RepID=A0A0F3MEZ9_ORITS|nr:hypothetical protein OTSGILL_0259 [Orientia tsutsugamushi str. Gilliam]